jgi:hypothetical protein
MFPKRIHFYPDNMFSQYPGETNIVSHGKYFQMKKKKRNAFKIPTRKHSMEIQEYREN